MLKVRARGLNPLPFVMARVILRGRGITAYKAASWCGRRESAIASWSPDLVPSASWASRRGGALGRAGTTDVWTGVADVPHVRLGPGADLLLSRPRPPPCSTAPPPECRSPPYRDPAYRALPGGLRPGHAPRGVGAPGHQDDVAMLGRRGVWWSPGRRPRHRQGQRSGGCRSQRAVRLLKNHGIAVDARVTGAPGAPQQPLPRPRTAPRLPVPPPLVLPETRRRRFPSAPAGRQVLISPAGPARSSTRSGSSATGPPAPRATRSPGPPSPRGPPSPWWRPTWRSLTRSGRRSSAPSRPATCTPPCWRRRRTRTRS